MTDQADAENLESSARGEAAWKEAKERIAARNEQARKAGRQRRESYEREREDVRRNAERRRREAARGPTQAPHTIRRAR